MSTAEIAALALRVPCGFCWAPPGTSCAPEGHHPERYLRAYRQGLITRQVMSSACLALPVVSPGQIVARLTGPGPGLGDPADELLSHFPPWPAANPPIQHRQAPMTHTTTHSPISVALALLDQRWPPVPALETGPAGEALARLQGDSRYLAGRLQQAITVLLAVGLPPMDAQTALLSQALDDAIAWRTDRPCGERGDEPCDQCGADWAQADRYHELARALGVMTHTPATTPPRADQPPAAHDDSPA